MFRSKTTFVIGAGASFELGLPIGSGLTRKIAEMIRTDPSTIGYFVDDHIKRAAEDYLTLKNQVVDLESLRLLAHLADKIGSNMPLAPSIDNYLNTHQSDTDLVMLGKIAIARCILQAERESYLYDQFAGTFHLPTRNDRFLGAWHVAFWQILVAGVKRDQARDLFKNCSFIVFNYDRCLEHFFYLALQSYFGVEPSEAAEIVGGANIVHAYGKVGGLPWQGDTAKTQFGQFENIRLLSIANGIRTFTETADEGVAIQMKSMIQDAASVVFLGFGFIDQNVALISPIGSDVTRVFATTFAMSHSEEAMAMVKIGQVLRRRANADYTAFIQDNEYQALMVNGTCSGLFADHRLRLSEPAPRQ